MMRGLFGKTKGLEGMKLPAMDAPMPNEITYTPKAQAIMSGEAPMPAAPQGRGMKDILLAALGGAADGAATFFGGQPLIAQNRQFQQMAAMRQAEQERQRSMELADYRTKLEMQQEFQQPEAPKPRFEQDGAGNLWALDPVTGAPLSDKPVFIDRTERIINQNGALIRIPNPWAQGADPANDAPDTLPPDFFKGGAGSNVSGGFRP